MPYFIATTHDNALHGSETGPSLVILWSVGETGCLSPWAHVWCGTAWTWKRWARFFESRTQVHTTACKGSMNNIFGSKENIWITQEQRQIPFKFHLIWLAQVNYSLSEGEDSWRTWQMLHSNYTSEVGMWLFVPLWVPLKYSRLWMFNPTCKTVVFLCI